jgi:hypothetical protein
MRFYLSLVLIFLSSTITLSQNIKGKVVDTTPLREKPHWSGNEIITITNNDEFMVVEVIRDKYFKVEVNRDDSTYIGYISQNDIIDTPELKLCIKNAMELHNKKLDAERATRDSLLKVRVQKGLHESDSVENFIRIRDEKEKISFYGKEDYNKAKSGAVWVGMDEGLIYISWGRPDKVNKTESKYGVSKQFVYPDNKYIYTEDGKVTTIQH